MGHKFGENSFNNPMWATIARDKFIIENNLPYQLNFPKLREKYEKTG